MTKNNIKTIIGLALIIIAIIAVVVSVIWYWTFYLMNPDMTGLRLFIENPYPTIIAIASMVGLLVGRSLIG